jgi:hypothetical protein
MYVIFISLQKDLALSSIIGPVLGFHSESIAVKHLHNTLFNCCSLRMSEVMASRLKEPCCSFPALCLFVTLNVPILFYYQHFAVCILVLPGLRVLHTQ